MTGFLSKRWRKTLWILLVSALPGLIIYSFFTKIFECPACYLYENTGDGLKNYYTLAYYVVHDDGWHFSGMNYPYGEHVIYTDNQPLLAFALRWLDRHVFDMDPHVTGTVNMLLLLSLYLAVLITYLLLRRWGVGRWWALGSSMCISFLSPQLLRFHGHFALGYIFFFPLLLLLMDLLVRDTRRRWLWGLLSCVFITMISLIHMYFLLLSLVVVTAYLIFWWWYHREEKNFIKTALPWLGAMIVIPAVFLLGLRAMTDPVQDRPAEPWGIDAHLVNFKTTFFPFMPPMDKAWTQILGEEKPINEKIAYTGLIGLLMLPAALYFLVRKRDNDFMNSHVKVLMGVSVVCWLMAAGVIYQNGFNFLWDALPILKQFRGLGRFGIPFYYIYMLVCSYLLWRVYLRLQARDLASIGKYMLILIFLFWGFEAWLNMKAIAAPVYHENKWMANDKNDYVPLLTSAGKKPEDFQAILQLPLVAIGNETVGVARGFWTLREGIHASMETGLPLIDYAMSRTSVSQGLDIIELIATPYAEKRRARKFDDRPILLLCEEEFVIPAERKWIEKAEKIGTYQSMTLYSIAASHFKTLSLPNIPEKDFPACKGWFNGFEDTPNEFTLTGQGALPITSAPYSIWKYSDNSDSTRQWQVSFWSRVDHKKGNVPLPRMMETDPQGAVLQNSGLHRESVLWSEAYGDWIEASFPLTTKGKGFTYELFIDQPGPVIDNLMIRAEGDTCIIRTPSMILYNNLPIPDAK
jgi:hypothetical protein